MEKLDRKITWVHVTFTSQGKTEINFATEKWREGKYLGKRSRAFISPEFTWAKISCLLRLITHSPNFKYTIVSWNGWSVCYERIYS